MVAGVGFKEHFLLSVSDGGGVVGSYCSVLFSVEEMKSNVFVDFVDQRRLN